MSTRGSNLGNPSRRIGWHAPAKMFADSDIGEPTKPSKPGFVGFVGGPYADYAIIRPQPSGRGRSSVRRLRRPSGNGAQPVQRELDCSTKTTRLMSWSERKTAAPEWRGGVVPAKVAA
jgi:hypothetical protein